MAYDISSELFNYQSGKSIGRELGKVEQCQELLIRFLSKKFGLSSKEIMGIWCNENLVKLNEALDSVLSAKTKLQVLEVLNEDWDWCFE